MKLHKNKELFQDAIIATSQQLGIQEIYVEKDYWVTFALFHIFRNNIGKETVFKGGTALSKCFGGAYNTTRVNFSYFYPRIRNESKAYT